MDSIFEFSSMKKKASSRFQFEVLDSVLISNSVHRGSNLSVHYYQIY